MENFDVPKLFKTMFTAPVEAIILAEEEYRKIWLKYLSDLERQVESLDMNDDEEEKKNFIDNALSMAPVMNFEAAIETETIMRISGTDETSVSGGLRLSVLHVSGRYSSSNAYESTIKAKANYELSNSRKMSLKEYLATRGISVESEDNFLDRSQTFLKGGQTEDNG